MKRFTKVFLWILMTLIILNIKVSPVSALSIENQKAVTFLVNNKLLTGDENGNLYLDYNLTREQMMVIISRLLGSEDIAVNYPTNYMTFTDVKKDDAYAPYIAWALDNSISLGYDDKTFGFGDTLTGWQAEAFLVRSLGFQNTNDNEIESVAKKLGITKNSKIDINKPITRADIALLMYNTIYAKNINDKVLGVVIGILPTSVNGNTNNTEETQNNLTVSQVGESEKSIAFIKNYTVDGSILQGSGFCISSDGIIVTNYHVIDKAQSLEITFDNNNKYFPTLKSTDVIVLDYDVKKDIAILKAGITNMPYLNLGDSDKIILGEDVVAIGNPEGLQDTLSTGVISAVNRKVGDNIYIQTTAPISHGSSGGALFNMKGEVIGITSVGISEGENLGFAIPINEVKMLKRDKNLTLPQIYAIEYPTITQQKPQMTYQEYADYLINQYPYLDISKTYVINFNHANLTLTDNNLLLGIYINENDKSFENVLDASKYYEKELVGDLAGLGVYVKNYFPDKSVTVSLIYSDHDYTTYPSAFTSNSLFSKTITYDSNTGKWWVYYPMIYISFDEIKKTYSWQWAW